VDGREQYEHRWKMEKHLKRRLSADEHVHHVNHIRSDNRLKNLRLMTPSAHSLTHRRVAETVSFVCPSCATPFIRKARYVRARHKNGQRAFYCSRRCNLTGGIHLPSLRAGAGRYAEYVALTLRMPTLSINESAKLMGVNRSNVCLWRRRRRDDYSAL
jgi:transposase-like protein